MSVLNKNLRPLVMEITAADYNAGAIGEEWDGNPFDFSSPDGVVTEDATLAAMQYFLTYARCDGSDTDYAIWHFKAPDSDQEITLYPGDKLEFSFTGPTVLVQHPENYDRTEKWDRVEVEFYFT